jgi:hypothetical protein
MQENFTYANIDIDLQTLFPVKISKRVFYKSHIILNV